MKNKELVFTLPFIPPTNNNAFKFTTRGRYAKKYPTQKMKEFIKLCNIYMNEAKIIPTDWYGVEIIYSFPIFYKNGNRKKIDLLNFSKHLIDYTLEKFVTTYDGDEFKDEWIKESSQVKTNSFEERTIITLYAIE